MSALPVYRAWHKERRMMYQVVAFNLQEQSVAMSYGDGLGWHVCSPDEIELMRQLPKNDLPVFEGDIIAWEYEDAVGWHKTRQVVKWNEDEACFDNVPLQRRWIRNRKIIGNMWANPELLQEGK